MDLRDKSAEEMGTKGLITTKLARLVKNSCTVLPMPIYVVL